MEAALSLGGNTGNGTETLKKALKRLEDGAFRIGRVSRIYRTSPVDCAPGTPDFLNLAVTGFWEGTPEKLLDLGQRIEVQLGRPANHAYHGCRTADIDIVTFGNLEIRTSRLILPHPEAWRRMFVLMPLAEIAPDWRIGSHTASEWLEMLKTSSGGSKNSAQSCLPLSGEER